MRVGSFQCDTNVCVLCVYVCVCALCVYVCVCLNWQHGDKVFANVADVALQIGCHRRWDRFHFEHIQGKIMNNAFRSPFNVANSCCNIKGIIQHAGIIPTRYFLTETLMIQPPPHPHLHPLRRGDHARSRQRGVFIYFWC